MARDVTRRSQADPTATTDARWSAIQSVVRVTVPARPENVALVRHLLDAFAGALPVGRARLGDMRLAVTEACTNVVRHAYHGGTGPLEVVMRPRPGALEVVVSDFGAGVGPSPDVNGPGLGLPLIAALSDRLDVQHARGAGTRLTMAFMARDAHAVGARA
jgi:anti-sigma regulatory factor (Ser/Thr protein kinase)